MAKKLSTVVTRMRLKKSEVFKIVEDIFVKLKHEDNDYFTKLKEVADRTRQQDLAMGVKQTIACWIETCFVNVLNKNCTLFVWDLLFLYSWNYDIQKLITLSIVMLLRFWIMRAKIERVHRILFEEPSRIYLSDLRSVVKHLQSGGSLKDSPTPTNFKIKEHVVSPYWEEIKMSIRRDSLVKKLHVKDLKFCDAVGKIMPQFCRSESTRYSSYPFLFQYLEL